MDRRTFLTRSAGVTAGVTAGMWAAPVIQTVGVSAAAGTPLGQRCTGHAYDARVVYTGVVNGFQGPVNQTSPNTDTQEAECTSLEFPCKCVGALNTELPPSPAPFAQSSTIAARDDCVENRFDGSCQTGVVIGEVGEQSVAINIAGPLTIPPTLVTAEVLRSEAEASCSGGAPQLGGNATLVAAEITIDGINVPFDPNPAPNTTVATPPALAALADVKIVLNEQINTGNKLEVNAIHITIEVLDAVSGLTQRADIKIAHAEADVHNCPPA